jgi:Flp pilus assembly protein TadG
VSLQLAVVFPLLLLVIFGGIQAALYYHARTVALSAAQEGVRVASAETGTAQAGAARAREFVADAGGPGVLSHLTVSPARTATTASITITGRALSVLPGVPAPAVSQTAERPVERFTSGAR